MMVFSLLEYKNANVSSMGDSKQMFICNKNV